MNAKEIKFPGPIAQMILKDNKEYYATTTVSSRIIPAMRGGALITDYDGFEFWDMHCDASVNNLGGTTDAVIEAIRSQMDTGVIFAEHHNAPTFWGAMLAKKLAIHSPVKKPSKVFFSSSGAEANETARKLCQAFRYYGGERKRKKAVYFENGFAGRTKGVLAATSSKPERQRDPFWDHCDKINSQYLPYPRRGKDWSELKEKFDALRLEVFDRLLIELPCQGEGGIIPVDEDAIQYLYEKTQKAGVLWVSDCIQTGMGRASDHLFGCDVFPWLKPDILTLAKALGGGLPIGATIFDKNIDWAEIGEHANTFGGGPLVMRAALAAFEELRQCSEKNRTSAIEAKIAARRKYLWQKRCVVDFRGQGAMWAIELATNDLRNDFVRFCEDMVNSEPIGLRLLGAGACSVRIMPPLTIAEKELDSSLDLLEKSLDMFSKTLC